MILDTSALFAILGDEPERRSFNEAIEAAESRRMSVATFVEISIVLEARYGAEGSRELDLFLERAAIELVPGQRARHVEDPRLLGDSVAAELDPDRSTCRSGG